MVGPTKISYPKCDSLEKDEILSRVSSCSSHCSIAVKRHKDQANSYKRKPLTGGLHTISEAVHYHHGREHGGRQVWCWRSS